MTGISKADWKLFQERIGGWQEAYMARLNEAYIELLAGDGPASEKFWQLEERIKRDRNLPGVRLELRKSEVDLDLARLLKDGVIAESDLEGFSESLRERVLQLARL